NVASQNVIGGAAAGARNVISANRGGVFIGSDLLPGVAEGNHVLGNFLGTDVTGRAALPNGVDGVWISGRARTTVIGPNSEGVDDRREGNVISGNREGGVVIRGADASGNVVAGNFIGVDATGLVGLGNCFGIYVVDGATRNTIGGRSPVA